MTTEKEAREIVERTKNRSRWDMENQTYVPETFPWLEKDIAKALQTKQDRIEELEVSLKGVKAGNENIQAAMKKKIDELEHLRMKLISKNMYLSTKIQGLESALRNCLATLQLCYSKKEYMPFSIQYVTKSLELVKKAIGVGK